MRAERRSSGAGRLLAWIVVLGALAAVAFCVAIYATASGASGAWHEARERTRDIDEDIALLAAEPLPSDAENAWPLLATLSAESLGDPSSLVDELPAIEPGELPTVADLAETDAVALSLSISPESEARIDAALTLPRLVIDCSFELDADCPRLLVLHALSAAAFLALRDVAAGDSVAGLTRIARAITLVADQVASARTMVELAIATRTASFLVRVATLAASRSAARGETTRGPERAAALASLRDALDTSMALDWSADRALVGEAHVSRLIAAAAARGGQGPLLSGEWASAYATERNVAYFDAVRAYARDPEHVPVPLVPEHEGWGLFLDPFDMTTRSRLDVVPAVDRVRGNREASLRNASAAARAIESARAESLRIP